MATEKNVADLAVMWAGVHQIAETVKPEKGYTPKEFKAVQRNLRKLRRSDLTKAPFSTRLGNMFSKVVQVDIRTFSRRIGRGDLFPPKSRATIEIILKYAEDNYGNDPEQCWDGDRLRHLIDMCEYLLRNTKESSNAFWIRVRCCILRFVCGC